MNFKRIYSPTGNKSIFPPSQHLAGNVSIVLPVGGAKYTPRCRKHRRNRGMLRKMQSGHPGFESLKQNHQFPTRQSIFGAKHVRHMSLFYQGKNCVERVQKSFLVLSGEEKHWTYSLSSPRRRRQGGWGCTTVVYRSSLPAVNGTTRFPS